MSKTMKKNHILKFSGTVTYFKPIIKKKFDKFWDHFSKGHLIIMTA